MGNSSSTPTFSYEQQLLHASSGAKLSVEVPDLQGPANPHATLPRRLAGLEGGLLSKPYPKENGGCSTILECFERGVRLFPNRPCFGTRVWETVGSPAKVAPAAAGEERKEMDGVVPSAGASSSSAASAAKYKIVDKVPVRGPYVWDSYAEADKAAKLFGAGLAAMGVKAKDNLGIFSSNRTEWMIAALGMYSQTMRVVSLYASLGEGAVEYIINHADVAVICVSKQNLPALLKSLPKMPGVKSIIQWDFNPKYNNVEDTVDLKDVATCKEAGIELVGLSTVIQRGEESKIQPNPAGPEDLAYIMYTSGTTGNPKGAMLLHRNVTATIASVEPVFSLLETDTYLSYLPLAHIFETVAQTAMLSAGGAVGFWGDNLRKLTNDMVDIKPTLFCGVPRVFTRIHQVVMNGVAEKNFLVRWFFNKALQHQSKLLRQGLPVDPSYDAKVFAPLRKRMGLDNVKVLVTGAAPMAAYLAEFLKVVTAKPVLEGYGMTEASAATSISTPADPNLGHTGPPVACAEVRLESIPDMGYLHTDPHPRGEVCVRGPAVFAGYWKDEENTAATIIDGWLHTGDVGRFNPNGTLSIIDRKKNLFKLAQGEYVAVEKVEQAYQRSPIVGQIFVYGNSFKSFLLGIVVPAPEAMAAHLHSKGWWPRAEKESTKLIAENFHADYRGVMEGPHKAEIKAWVVEQLRQQEKGLKGFEKVTDFLIESDVNNMGSGFTEANGCLTPTFKLRRPQILQKYIRELKEMYGANKEPVGADEKWPGEQ